MKTAVTYILPSLNVADYIKECLDSVLSQSMNQIEIICIDAGSTDGTREIIQSYISDNKTGKELRLIDSEIKSYGYQVNLGIREAKGDYIAVLETDDCILEDMAEKMYEAAERSQADMVRSDFEAFQIMRDGSRRSSRFHMYSEESSYGLVENIGEKDFYYLNDHNIWRGLYRKNFLRDNNISLNESKGAAYQDIGFVMKCFFHAKKTVYVNEPFYRYRTFRQGSSSYSLNCVRFLYQEYSKLIEQFGINAKHVPCAGFYRRMLQSFLTEYKKTLNGCEFNPDSEYLKPYYSFFISELSSFFDLNRDRELISKDVDYEECRLLFTDVKQLALIMKEEADKRESEIQGIIDKIKGHKVYIFGAGLKGMNLLSALEERGITIEGFLDNNNDLSGKNIDGYPIWNANEQLLSVSRENAVVCLMKNKYTEEIIQQLISANSETGFCGLSMNQIVLIDK